MGELGVDALEGGRLANEDVDLDVIAYRHLVEQAAKLRLHERKAFRQALALGKELGRSAAIGLHRRGGGARRILPLGSDRFDRPHGTTTCDGRLLCWLTYALPVDFWTFWVTAAPCCS